GDVKQIYMRAIHRPPISATPKQLLCPNHTAAYNERTAPDNAACVPIVRHDLSALPRSGNQGITFCRDLLDGLSDRTLLATGGLADFACGHGREHDGASGSQADAWPVCDRRGSVFGRLAASAEQQAAVIFAEMMQKCSFLGTALL